MKKVTIKNHETKRTYKVLLKDDDTNVQNTIIELRKKYKYKVFYARELGASYKLVGWLSSW